MLVELAVGIGTTSIVDGHASINHYAAWLIAVSMAIAVVIGCCHLVISVGCDVIKDAVSSKTEVSGS